MGKLNKAEDDESSGFSLIAVCSVAASNPYEQDL